MKTCVLLFIIISFCSCNHRPIKPDKIKITSPEIDSNKLTLDTASFSVLSPKYLFKLSFKDFWQDSSAYQEFFIGRIEPDTCHVLPGNLIVKEGKFYIPNVVENRVNIYDILGKSVGVIPFDYKYYVFYFHFLNNGNYLLTSPMGNVGTRGLELDGKSKKIISRLSYTTDLDVQILKNGYFWGRWRYFSY